MAVAAPEPEAGSVPATSKVIKAPEPLPAPAAASTTEPAPATETTAAAPAAPVPNLDKKGYPYINAPLDEPEGKVLTPAERANAIAQLRALAEAQQKARASGAPIPTVVDETQKPDCTKPKADGTLPDGCAPAPMKLQ